MEEEQVGTGQPRREEPLRVLVLGAGYGGMAAFLELQGGLTGDSQLTLVNGSRYHYYTTELHTFAAGIEDEWAVRLSLREVVNPPARLEVGWVQALDVGARQVKLKNGAVLVYDYLVIGLGSEPEYFGIPGAREHGVVIGNIAGAERLRQRLADLLAQPGRPRVVIAGGGLTGIEVAGELVDAYGERLELTLLEAAPQIMLGFDPYLAEASTRVLTGKGVDVRTSHKITGVQPGQLHLEVSGGDGEPAAVTLPFDSLVWAGGVRGPALLTHAGLDVTRRGRAVVDEYLRAKGHPEVLVVGDAAAWTDPGTGRELPPTAQAAQQMGRYAGRTALRMLAGKPLKPFTPQIKGVFASLGQHQGVGMIGAEHFSGLPAMAVKKLIEAQHAYEAGGLGPIVRKLFHGAPRLVRHSHGVARQRQGSGPPPPAPEDARPNPEQ